MNSSETIGTLAGALAKAQGKMESAIKDATNPFFKSHYADLASIWKAAKDSITENGLAVTQVSRFSEPLVYSNDKNETLVIPTVLVETVLMHESGEWISSEITAPMAGKQDAQAIGSAITYLRRYGLASILGVVTEDDDGNSAVGNQADGSTTVNKPVAQKQAPKAIAKPTPAPEPKIAPAVDYLGTGEAKRKEMKLRALCTGLNKAGETFEGEKWSSETLDKYAQNGFDKPLKQLDADEMAVMISDLQDTLAERQALTAPAATDEATGPRDDEAEADTSAQEQPTGEVLNAQQLSALNKLCEIKKKDSAQVAENASDGRTKKFEDLTTEEAAEAIKALSKS